MLDHTLRPWTSFWLVVSLCQPVFAAFLIVVSASHHPHMSANLLILLTGIAPGCLLGAIIFTVQVRRSMPRQLFRGACAVLLLAFVAGVAAAAIVRTWCCP